MMHDARLIQENVHIVRYTFWPVLPFFRWTHSHVPGVHSPHFLSIFPIHDIIPASSPANTSGSTPQLSIFSWHIRSSSQPKLSTGTRACLLTIPLRSFSVPKPFCSSSRSLRKTRLLSHTPRSSRSRWGPSGSPWSS
jgi:hypothetical protein